MGRLRRFLALPPAERRAVVGAAVLIGAVRMGLPLLPFRNFRRLLAFFSHGRAAHPLPADRVAWAVATAARRVPGPNTCLVQALAAQALLARHGHVTELRIGVARAGEGIEAHAWLEQHGRPVFGAPDRDRHTMLPPLESGRS
ncbi:MAG TPA: lasso peptide biosynthesis B2 protein [Gemmatimonadales bacterium]|nr:lasso peptide biosynthesis B2 protein [Gemmatimonadales bacterium]